MTRSTGRPSDNGYENMTIEEVADHLRLKLQTIYKRVQEKRIPAAKLRKD